MSKSRYKLGDGANRTPSWIARAIKEVRPLQDYLQSFSAENLKILSSQVLEEMKFREVKMALAYLSSRNEIIEASDREFVITLLITHCYARSSRDDFDGKEDLKLILSFLSQDKERADEITGVLSEYLNWHNVFIKSDLEDESTILGEEGGLEVK